MKKKKCGTPYCKNNPDTRQFCSTCRSRESRKRNPVKYSYTNLKANSKRRKKDFQITFEEFVELCNETNYIAGKGKTKTSYSLDRKKNELGYIKGNIRVIPLGDNSRKGTKVLNYDWQNKSAIVTNYNSTISNNVDNYF